MEAEFRSVEDEAIQVIDGGHSQVVDRMLGFMNQEFDGKFKILLNSVKEKMVDGEGKEKDIAKAEQALDEISLMRDKLNSIISMEYQDAC